MIRISPTIFNMCITLSLSSFCALAQAAEPPMAADWAGADDMPKSERVKFYEDCMARTIAHDQTVFTECYTDDFSLSGSMETHYEPGRAIVGAAAVQAKMDWGTSDQSAFDSLTRYIVEYIEEGDKLAYHRRFIAEGSPNGSYATFTDLPRDLKVEMDAFHIVTFRDGLIASEMWVYDTMGYALDFANGEPQRVAKALDDFGFGQTIADSLEPDVLVENGDWAGRDDMNKSERVKFYEDCTARTHAYDETVYTQCYTDDYRLGGSIETHYMPERAIIGRDAIRAKMVWGTGDKSAFDNLYRYIVEYIEQGDKVVYHRRFVADRPHGSYVGIDNLDPDLRLEMDAIHIITFRDGLIASELWAYDTLSYTMDLAGGDTQKLAKSLENMMPFFDSMKSGTWSPD